MAGSIESLERSLRACDGYGNDHDPICDCRPVDVRAALQEIERLRAANDYQADTIRKLNIHIGNQELELGRLWAALANKPSAIDGPTGEQVVQCTDFICTTTKRHQEGEA